MCTVEKVKKRPMAGRVNLLINKVTAFHRSKGYLAIHNVSIVPLYACYYYIQPDKVLPPRIRPESDFPGGEICTYTVL
jgi:hypothetical protein